MISLEPIGIKHKPSKKPVSRPGRRVPILHGVSKETTAARLAADPQTNSPISLRAFLESVDAVDPGAAALESQERTSKLKSN
jgi:hypothetical protein